MFNKKKSFSPFSKLCGRQKVDVHPQVARAGQRERSSVTWSSEPNGLYAAIVEAGSILRKDPDTELASGILVPPARPRNSLNCQLAARTLIAMLNASIEPVPGASWDTTFRCLGTNAITACDNADSYFGMVVAQMRDPKQPLPGFSDLIGYQIITGENDRPIAVRKADGSPSALSLTDITINGIPYPAGSIMRAEIINDFYVGDVMPKGYYKTEVPPDIPTRVGVEQVSHIAFQRLSAFAGSLDDRSKHFTYYWRMVQQSAAVNGIQSYTMADIADCARTAVSAATETTRDLRAELYAFNLQAVQLDRRFPAEHVD